MRTRFVSGIILAFGMFFYPLVGLPQDAETRRLKALQKAAAALEKGDPVTAESLLKPLLSQSPDDAVSLNLLGLVRAEQQQSSAAEVLFRRAIADSNGRLPGPHINLARLESFSRPIDAVEELRAALIIKPDDLQAQTLLRSICQHAAGSSQAGKTDEAIDLLTRAHEISPQDAEISFHLGMILFQMARDKEAEKVLKQAVESRPGYPEAIYALARVHLAENEASVAEQEMRDYLRLKPQDPTAYYGLGYVLVTEQKLEQARAAFQKSLQLQPEQTESVFQLGEIALEQGDRAVAEERFTAVLKRDEHHGGALTGIGVICFRNADYVRAKEELQRAIASSPSYQKAHYYYGLTLAKLGDKADSEREFERAKQLQKPHTVEPHL